MASGGNGRMPGGFAGLIGNARSAWNRTLYLIAVGRCDGDDWETMAFEALALANGAAGLMPEEWTISASQLCRRMMRLKADHATIDGGRLAMGNVMRGFEGLMESLECRCGMRPGKLLGAFGRNGFARSGWQAAGPVKMASPDMTGMSCAETANGFLAMSGHSLEGRPSALLFGWDDSDGRRRMASCPVRADRAGIALEIMGMEKDGRIREKA